MTSEPRVTVVIPTYNRAAMLAASLRSALRQDFTDLRVLVLDNASSDDTAAVVGSFSDPRIDYLRNDQNIGLVRNFNRALSLNRSPYVCILQDDDELLPQFVSATVNALEACEEAAFAYTHVRFIDTDGGLLGRQDTRGVPAGRIEGLELLQRVVTGDNWVIHMSSAMMRKAALEVCGRFDPAHSRHAVEFNLYFRLAERFDLVFVAQELARVRQHPGQENITGTHGTGPLAMLAERFDAVAYLLRSERAERPDYRKWLADRLLALSMTRSELTAQLVPGLNLDWQQRLDMVREEISGLIPAGSRVILAEDNSWGMDLFPGLESLPFLERDGQYWGPPPDDETAQRELERMRRAGADYLVVGWPAFWWLDYYSGLRDHLHSRYRCLLKNSRLLVFELGGPAAACP